MPIGMRLGTRREYCHAHQQRARNLFQKNPRPPVIRQQGPWRDVLRIQDSAGYAPAHPDIALNHRRCGRSNASRRNNSSDGSVPVTNGQARLKRIHILAAHSSPSAQGHAALDRHRTGCTNGVGQDVDTLTRSQSLIDASWTEAW